MKIATHNGKDMETQLLNVEPRKNKSLVVLISLLGFICLVLLGWSLFLTLDHANMKQELMESDHQLDDLKRTVLESFGISQESKSGSTFMEEENKPEVTENNFRHLLTKRSTGNNTRQEQRPKERKRRESANEVTAIHVEAVPSSSETDQITVSGGWLNRWKVADLHITTTPTFGVGKLNTSGYITVPKDGVYYLYSQVVFIRTPTNHLSAQIKVGKWGAERFTKCVFTQNMDEEIYSTCHASGIKFMQEGDRIAIYVTPEEVQVSMNPKFTYFGAVLLGTV